MSKTRKILLVLVALLVYAGTARGIVYFVAHSGVYPSGSDTMCHLYKGSVLYHAILKGDWYPLYDTMWYNGVQNMRYWAPLPVYVLAACQAIVGGNLFDGYLAFLWGIAFFGAMSWLVIGLRHKRPIVGALNGLLWFFLPNNLTAIFVEGNLPRAVCMVFLPLFVSYVHDYLLEQKWSALPKITIVFVLITLCHTGYAGMIALGLLLFLFLFRLLYHKAYRKKIFHVIGAVIFGFLLTGIWLYPSLQGGITSTDSSQVMKSFFQDAVISLNPLLRLSGGFNYFYFGLAAFLLILFGMFFSQKKSMAGFWCAFLIFICTTTTMYSALVLLPGSQYLWMLRFISIALCFMLYAFLLWDTLKRPFLVGVFVLLLLDVIPSLSLLYGEANSATPEARFAQMDEETLIGEAREVTTQRLALFDLSTLGADGAYLTAGAEDGVASMFGAGWQSSATATNISLLNEALSGGNYLYLFDRSIEMGCDTILIRTSQAAYSVNIAEELDNAAGALGFSLVDEVEDYRLYHLATPETFGVKTTYHAIGIGTSASLMALDFPSIEETTDTNLNHYTYDELIAYDTIYLAGFTYDDREEAEKMILALSENGVRIIVLADGIPVEKGDGLQTFLGVNCQAISFNNGYPELDTIDGVLHCDLFPAGYTKWQTVYLNGLDEVWGSLTDLDQELAFYGTKYNDNLIFIGLNLTYHYALTKDENVGVLLSHALKVDGSTLPEREIVTIEIAYDGDQITIVSPDSEVDTTLAYHDIFESKQPIESKRHLLYVNEGTTVIEMRYPYLVQGLCITIGTAILTVIFWVLTWRGQRKKKTENLQEEEKIHVMTVEELLAMKDEGEEAK